MFGLLSSYPSTTTTIHPWLECRLFSRLWSAHSERKTSLGTSALAPYPGICKQQSHCHWSWGHCAGVGFQYVQYLLVWEEGKNRTTLIPLSLKSAPYRMPMCWLMLDNQIENKLIQQHHVLELRNICCADSLINISLCRNGIFYLISLVSPQWCGLKMTASQTLNSKRWS